MADVAYAPVQGNAKMVGIGAVLVAAGIGYAAGILFAPRSGRDTRQMIHRNAEKAKLQARVRMVETKLRVRRLLSDANRRAEQLRDEAERAARENSR